MAHHRKTALSLLVAAVLVTTACTGDTTDSTQTTTSVTEPVVAGTTTTTTALPVTTTTASAQQSEALRAALSVKDSFFVAFNAGDPTAVMDLFTADADFGDADGRQWFEELLAWNVAQGTRYTPSDCTADPDADSLRVDVSCPFATHDILTIESGGPPVPFAMRMLITSDGIASYWDRFGSPDFNTVGVPFDRWMNQHHPNDAESVEFATWESIDEAVANGTLLAGYAAEWGQYLETNGCAYNESC
jgi:hypothetical protein